MASDLLEKLARVEGYNEAHPKYDLLLRYIGLNNGRENLLYPIIGKLEKRQPSPDIRKINPVTIFVPRLALQYHYR
jgi:hypothetical protein